MQKKRRTFVAAIVIALLAVSVLAVPAQAKTVKNYRITGEKHYYKPYEGAWRLGFETSDEYDKNGNHIKSDWKNYSEDGTVLYSSKTITTYDKQGREKTRKEYQDDKLKALVKYVYKDNQTISLKYNGKKKLEEKTITTSANNKSVTKTYNAKGKLVGSSISTFGKNKSTTKSYNAKGKLEETSVSTFSKKKETWKGYDGKGRPIYSTVTNLDNKGRQTKSVSIYYEDGKESNRYTSTFSYSGKWITETNLYKSGNDQNKHVMKYRVDKTGIHIRDWTRSYGDDGKLISESTFKYKFYTKGAAKGCVKQEIEYYDGEETSKTDYTVKVIKQKQ